MFLDHFSPQNIQLVETMSSAFKPETPFSGRRPMYANKDMLESLTIGYTVSRGNSEINNELSAANRCGCHQLWQPHLFRTRAAPLWSGVNVGQLNEEVFLVTVPHKHP